MYIHSGLISICTIDIIPLWSKTIDIIPLCSIDIIPLGLQILFHYVKIVDIVPLCTIDLIPQGLEIYIHYGQKPQILFHRRSQGILPFFPTQFLSLNPILQSESKNSKNSGIFWNLWNLSANMTYLAFLPKQNTFPTQIEVPGPILMSKRRNLRDSSNLEFILESLESRFQISEILPISPF